VSNFHSNQLCHRVKFLISPTLVDSTFIGIAVHTATASDVAPVSANLAAGVRQDATGLLGTTAQWSDLVSASPLCRVACPTARPSSCYLSENKTKKDYADQAGLLGYTVRGRWISLYRSCSCPANVCIPSVFAASYD